MSYLQSTLRTTAADLLQDRFGPSPAELFTLFVPGRVNLIGEHIDYHDLPVLPIAIQRGLAIAFRKRPDSHVQAISAAKVDCVSFPLRGFSASRQGCWGNYLKAATKAATTHWGIVGGMEAALASNLPVAAGLSSSSALLVAFTLALLIVNGKTPSLAELLAVLPDGEQYVGTRGGGMDHAAILGSRSGCALRVRFKPMELEHVPIPLEWRFLVAHSLTSAAKSAGQKEHYNARREAGARALRAAGAQSYAELLEEPRALILPDGIDEVERKAFRHVTGEARRVSEAVAALQVRDYARFGALLVESHRSLRDDLAVSSPALDQLVESALAAGAGGARLTGAGFGGCVVALCHDSTVSSMREKLIETFYAGKPEFDPDQHLFVAEPSDGAALVPQSSNYRNESGSHGD